MASLFKRNGWFYLSFYDKDRQPQQKQVALKTRSKRIAERQKHEIEDAYEAGNFDPWSGKTPLESDTATLGRAVAAFLASRSNLSPYTVTKYRSVLGLLEEYLGSRFPVSAIEPVNIAGFLSSTDKRPITKRTYRTTLSPFFNWLIARGLLCTNPTQDLRLKRVPQKFPRFLTPEEVGLLVEAIAREVRDKRKLTPGACLWLIPIVQANVFLGLRAGELVNLRWEDVDLKRRTVQVVSRDDFSTKNGRDRVIPLADAPYDVLRRLNRSSPYVFPSHTGKRLGRQYLSRRFKYFARKAGLGEEINFHATRHTALSWLAQQGVSVEAIRLYAGHSSIAVTQKYMHLSPRSYREQISKAFMAVDGRGMHA